MTRRDETSERLGNVLDRRGCDPTEADRATAERAEAEGVSAATLDHAIDDAQKRPNVTHVAAYALKTARSWTAKHAEPLPVVDAGAMPREINGHGRDELDSIAKDRKRIVDGLTGRTRRQQHANEPNVIDVPMHEVGDDTRHS